jgi:hypothetical protein
VDNVQNCDSCRKHIDLIPYRTLPWGGGGCVLEHLTFITTSGFIIVLKGAADLFS